MTVNLYILYTVALYRYAYPVKTSISTVTVLLQTYPVETSASMINIIYAISILVNINDNGNCKDWKI